MPAAIDADDHIFRSNELSQLPRRNALHKQDAEFFISRFQKCINRIQNK